MKRKICKAIACALSVLLLLACAACAQQGPSGAQGQPGINGINGADGKDGRDGIDGVDGKDGLNGQDGKDGIDGKDGLNGQDGQDGKDGIDGKDGLNGQDGKDGIDGLNGLNGQDGKDGIDGKDGLNGQDGKDGIDGKDGLNGQDGKDGIDGRDGLNGQDGKDGKDGKDGQDGKDGEKGEKGEQGVGVIGAYIDENGHLCLLLSDGSVCDAGAIGIAQKKTYTVIYKDYDDTFLGFSTVEEGASAQAPSVPNHPGRVFCGWDKETEHVQSDMVVTAQYKFTDAFFVESETDEQTGKLMLTFRITQPASSDLSIMGFQVNIRYSANYSVMDIIARDSGIRATDHAQEGYISVAYFNLAGKAIDNDFAYLTVELDASACIDSDRVFVELLYLMDVNGEDIADEVVIDCEYIYS